MLRVAISISRSYRMCLSIIDGMRISKKFFYCIAICASHIVISFLVCSLFRGYYESYYEIYLLSTLKTPVFHFLKDIKKDFHDGNIDSAREKLLFLNNEWYLFYKSRDVKYGMGNLLLKWQRYKDAKEEQRAD